MGRRLFHQIFPPKTSAPVFRDPVRKINVNPMAGIMARYPKYGRYLVLIIFARKTNASLVPIQPIKNSNITFFILLSIRKLYLNNTRSFIFSLRIGSWFWNNSCMNNLFLDIFINPTKIKK